MCAFDIFLENELLNCISFLLLSDYLFLPPLGMSVGCSPISLSRFYVLRRNAVLLFRCWEPFFRVKYPERKEPP